MAASTEARQVVEALTDLYETILRMIDRPISDLHHAPEGGPDIPSVLGKELTTQRSSQVINFKAPHTVCFSSSQSKLSSH